MSEAAPFEVLTLRSPGGATATLCRHGAQVLGWRARGASRDRLFLSSRSQYADGAAIRGGIPVIFPQFSGFGPLPKHGFARNRCWTLLPGTDPARAVFELTDDGATRALWPHAFRARLEVTLGDERLDTTLVVSNPGPAPLSFTAALHTYLAVTDIAQVRVRGLAGHPFLDATRGLARELETREAVSFDGEFDRVFEALPGALVLEDGAERLAIEREGFADAVVWNPGADKGAALSDLDDGDYRRFLCIEPAVFNPPVTLAPGDTWRGLQRLRLL